MRPAHDWPGWLAAGAGRGAAGAGSTWLLARLGSRVVARPLGALTAALLAALEPPAPLETVVARLSSGLDGGAAAGAVLAARVREQAEQLYRAGLLDVLPPGHERETAATVETKRFQTKGGRPPRASRRPPTDGIDGGGGDRLPSGEGLQPPPRQVKGVPP